MKYYFNAVGLDKGKRGINLLCFILAKTCSVSIEIRKSHPAH
jgi:hypothetical protein